MKTVYRNNSFETNSSSSHSLILSYATANTLSKYQEDLYPYFGEYGWGYDELRTPAEKLSYLLTAYALNIGATYCEDEEVSYYLNEINNYISKLNKQLENENFTCRISFIDESSVADNFYKFGYIDHQSGDTAKEALEYCENNLADYLFNDDNYAIIDNDNH